MKVTTFLMFEGQAEAAMNFYVGLFKDARIHAIERYGSGESGVEGSVKLASFSLAGQGLMCIDSAVAHGFTFTPSMSLYVDCDDEQDIDHLYAKLGENGTLLMPLDNYGFSAKFAWLNDKFGVSWQLNLPVTR